VTPDSPCLGDLLTALVDGELGHAARETALAHVAGCAACRADIEDQRQLKARLAALHTEAPSPQLTSRLLALSVPGVEPAVRSRAGRRPVTLRSPRAPGGAGRPASTPSRRRLRRVTTVGGSVLLLAAFAAALVLGGPPAGGASTPIDPGADVFVVDHVSTTSRLPLREPVGAATVPSR
jgi:anti-sigma factor RsiW